MGSDLINLGFCLNADMFQSTLPHGERQLAAANAERERVFQSTLPHGERPFLILRFSCDIIVSIHAPTWGATQLNLFSSIDEMFQSTLPHGERHPEREQYYLKKLFQSTLPHGERLIILIT